MPRKKKAPEAPAASLHEGTSIALKDLRPGQTMICTDGRKRTILSIDPVVDPINGSPKNEVVVALDDGPGKALQELVRDAATIVQVENT